MECAGDTKVFHITFLAYYVVDHIPWDLSKLFCFSWAVERGIGDSKIECIARGKEL